jgi:uncharacterized protein (DUF302 family)
MTTDGLIRTPSAFDVAQTLDRLEAEVRARGLTVFARIDHAKGAREAGLVLRPTALLIFGNAKGGTPLMQAHQESGIDLPLKVLVYQDADGRSWLAYTDMHWLAQRHGIAQLPNIAALSAVLDAVTAKAAKPA